MKTSQLVARISERVAVLTNQKGNCGNALCDVYNAFSEHLQRVVEFILSKASDWFIPQTCSRNTLWPSWLAMTGKMNRYVFNVEFDLKMSQIMSQEIGPWILNLA